MPPAASSGNRLESWKEIAAYLRRTVRTVQRWEREQGLPIHRLQHNKLATIYAFPDELDRWWNLRRPAIEAAEAADQSSVNAQVAGAAVEATSSGVQPASLSVSKTLVRWSAVGVMCLGAFTLLWGVGRIMSASSVDFDQQESRRLYSRGREFWNQRTPGAFVAALHEFERAAAHDPSNALAYSGLADTYSLLWAFGIRPKHEALPHARAAAVKSLELGPNLAEPHASMSFVLWEEGQRHEAMSEARRAIALNPKYATAHHWYALFLQDSGHFVEAIREAQIAQELQPLSPIIGADLSIMLRSAGRVDEARVLLQRLLRAHPTYSQLHVELADLHRRMGNYDLALQGIRDAVRYGDDRPLLIARMGWLEARQGNTDAARWAARRVKALEDQGVRVLPEVMAEVMAAAGDLDRAYAILEDGIRAEASWVLVVTTDELYEAFRADPRWPIYESRLRRLAQQLQNPPVIQPAVK